MPLNICLLEMPKLKAKAKQEVIKHRAPSVLRKGA